MSEDIHKWTDGQYTLMFDEHTFFVWDNENDERMTALQTTERLNEQKEIIQDLERKLKKYAKIGEEQLKQIIELQEENEQLKKDVENWQEVVAEVGATLLMNGFEIEINGENLSELVVDDE